MVAKQNSELDKFGEMLSKSIIALFHERGELDFSKAPESSRRQITEYEGKMRADGMEKFDNEATYVSAVNFYANEKDMNKNKTLGALIVYVQEEYLSKLMKLLKYPPIDDESEEAMRDSCGTLCNIVSGRFKSEIVSAGYIELEMSHFKNFRNSSFEGIDFCYAEYDMIELTCEIGGEKRLVIEMTMGAIPRQ